MIEIMGGDLSLTATGLCLPDDSTCTIKTGGADKGDQRLVIFRQAFTHYLRCWPIDLMILERAGRFKSQDAAVAVGMIHGIAREVLAEFKIPYAYIAPAVLKMFATGKGNADKKEMVIACNQARQGPTEAVVTHSDRPPFTATTVPPPTVKPITDDNQADAWWLRRMGIWHEFGAAPGLQEIGQVDLDGHGVRHHAVFGPWPTRAGGAKWPDRTRAAVRRV